MGAYMSKPNTEKVYDHGANQWISYSSCSMQGWRMHQEDAHNCIPDFDGSRGISFFAVYDGHGGSEVARYCAEHMPDFLMNLPSYDKLDMKETLKQLFLDFDATLVTPETRVILSKMSETDKADSSSEKGSPAQVHCTADVDDVDEEDDESYSELLALRAEANQPLEHVLEQYGGEDALPVTIKTILDTRRQNKVGECSLNSDKPKSLPTSGSESDKTCLPSCATAVSNTGNAVTAETVQQRPTLEFNSETGVVAASCDDCENRDVLSGTLEKPTNDSTNNPSPINTADDIEDESDDESADFDPSIGLEDSDNDDDDEEEEEDDDEEVDDDDDEEEEDDDDDDELAGFSIPRSIADTEESEPGIDSGTTACVAVLKPVNDAIRLYVANAGDSRAVLCRGGAAVDLSVDHKPEDEDEKARIVAAGGTVTRDGRVNGGLNLSRALGDHSYKQTPNIPLTDQMITPSPDVTEIDLIPSADEFLVIACDGVWNSMTSQEVVEFIQDRLHSPNSNKNDNYMITSNNNKNNNSDVIKNGSSVNESNSFDELSTICNEIFDHCLAPNTDGDGTGCDNMTCIIVRFNNLPGWVEYYAKKNNASIDSTIISSTINKNTSPSPRKRTLSHENSNVSNNHDVAVTNSDTTNGNNLNSSPSEETSKRPKLDFPESENNSFESVITTNGTVNNNVTTVIE
ncbi:hypothetical protein MN116_008252 [Schistosoma mekongi]|uniref:protein-serine/threonine phosphatase n=1 Tax=Schistosoma mekongi TaxID=38744 RepID=A0AAE1Z758_SCHME|nr:hypothetical protein MN116_008252 [Schistosoma mekongi]